MNFLAFSGGLDSTTLLYYLLKEGHEVSPVFFYYGSKHNEFELSAAQEILKEVKPDQELTVVDLRPTRAFDLSKSALINTGPAIPDLSYKDAGSLAATVVPGRNMLMASILACMSESTGGGHIYLAVHMGDHELYPDCRPGFLTALGKAIWFSSGERVCLSTPFALFDKQRIVSIGLEHGVPFHLTRSCYKQQELSCGKCATCLERIQAFAGNGQKDPIQYAD